MIPGRLVTIAFSLGTLAVALLPGVLLWVYLPTTDPLEALIRVLGLSGWGYLTGTAAGKIARWRVRTIVAGLDRLPRDFEERGRK